MDFLVSLYKSLNLAYSSEKGNFKFYQESASAEEISTAIFAFPSKYWSDKDGQFCSTG